MKKFKHIVPFLLALIMALAIPLAGCDSCGDNGPTTTFQSININTDNVKKEYLYGETFTSEGLVVSIELKHSDVEEPEVKILDATEYTVDSTAFRNDDYGEHTIYVSYTYGGITKSADYDVTVVAALQRLEVDTSNVKTSYFKGDSFTADGMVVKAYIKKAGVADLEEKTLPASDYKVNSSAFNGRRTGTYEIKVSYTYEDYTRETSFTVVVIDFLDRIELDTTNVTTKFYSDSTDKDEFTSEGLVAKAYIWNKETKKLEETVLSNDDIIVDSSAFNKEKIGVYSISVSYTFEGVTKTATYEVTVLDSADGLNVELKDGVSDTYTLTAEKTTVEIDVNDIVVKETNRDGSIAGEVTGYDVTLYKGSEEIALTDGKANVTAGAYNILVKKESTRNPGFMRTGFIVIYVNDDIVNFELKEGNFTQSSGEDIMSKSWVFTATYASGATKEISATSCEFDIDTMTVAENVSAVVTYTDYNAKGGSITKSVEITYSITRVYGRIVNTYDYSAIDNSAMGGDQTDLKQSDLKGPNSFLKLGDGTAKYRNKDKWNTGANVVEIKNAGFVVTFEGVGKITIGYSSTGSSNWSRVGVTDSSGNYIPATYDATNAAITTDAAANVYRVYGTSPSELTFIITKPGTYSIVSEPNADYNRGCRIHSIEMEDNVDDPTKLICNIDFSDTAKFNTGNLATTSETEPVEIKDASGTSIGLSVTKSTSAVGTANRITTVNEIMVLQLQGSATTEQNSLLINVAAGKLKITVKYFHSSSGRYIDVLGGDGTVLGSSSAKPTSGNEIIEYTFEVDVAADSTLYLGSHSSAINITYLKVEKA